MNDWSLADRKKEETLQKNCLLFGIQYREPGSSECDTTRRNDLKGEINRARKKYNRENRSESEKKKSQEKDKKRKATERENESTETKKRRQDADRAYRQQVRSNQTPEQRQKENNELKQRMQGLRRKRDGFIGTRSSSNNQPQKSTNGGGTNTDILRAPDVSDEVKEDVVKRAIEALARTRRQDGRHCASVCLICDRIIKGVEKVHPISKDRVLENKHRLSVECFETHFGIELNPILVRQYEVDGLEGLLLSPRSHCTGDIFEACSTCFSSLKPAKARKCKTPPKWAIANGFVIGSIPPQLTYTNSEGTEKVYNIDPAKGISDVMSAAVSRQRPYGYVFAFNGGAQKSLMGQYHFFETDQETVGSVVNYFRSTGANAHILCALCGRFTPKQREIARTECQLDTDEYIALITWLIQVAKHHGYIGLLPPEDCPQPKILDGEETDNNTDASQNSAVENEFDGGTFTFTSSSDPTESSGVYRDNAAFTMALLNRASPTMLLSRLPTRVHFRTFR